MDDVTIPRLHDAYEKGTRPEEVINRVYDALERRQDPGIFIAKVERRQALAAAAALAPFDPAAMPLWGVPFAVKDNIDVAGLTTTAACPEYAYVPERSAPVVERLLAAGAILIGKTNLDQFATGLVGVRSPYPPPRNALDETLVPGGSSSGSGVAVALGIVSFALGTDTAGSGRVPAALNNVVGLKPTRGAIPTRGVVPACRTLDCVSIFAGTVDDAWSVFGVAAGYDAEDPYSRRVPTARVSLPPIVRFAIPDSGGRIFGSRAAEKAFDAALRLLGGLDLGPVQPVDMKDFYDTAALLYEGAWVAERYAAIRDFIEAKPDSLYPVTREIISGAARLTAADAFAGQYRLAEQLRRSESFWKEHDVLVVPSIPDVCTLADVAAEPVAANSRLGTYTNFVNLLDLAAIAVPGPFRDDGRPAGITLIAPAGRDGLLAALADRLHRAAGVAIGTTNAALPPSRAIRSSAPAGMIEIGVVGAHLSGMTLNGDLTRRGGVFVRAAETAPGYRLFVLDGGPPQRPGLVRSENGGGRIALEIWALPPSEFGDFVATVPSPLSIGTVALADGSSVKGFLCEAIAVRDAKEITGLGGWRKYLAAQEKAVV